MAASLSRPDPTSPASVAEAGFATARRGYSQDEVRAFLTSVGAELRRLHERERQLEAELRAARASLPGRVEFDDEAATNLLGEETVRVLQTARESASQIKIRAEENAARSLREAHDEANRVRQEAEVESARRRHDAQSEAEAEVALAKQQGREMVNEARAYRERVLADLERRTKLARQHIDELAHGRERLLQVFERARLVAVDVSAELQSFVGPDEFVNFAPTTGPVPLMVPATKLETQSQPAVDATAAIDTVLGDAAAADELVEPEPDEPEGAEGAEAVSADATGADGDIPDGETVNSDVEATIVDEVEVATQRADHNVVALFPGRTVVEIGIEGGIEGDVGIEPARPDVDDIFARLRNDASTDVVPAAASDPVPPAVDEPDAPVEPAVSTPFTRRDEAIVPLIVTAARKLKRTLADEQNGVLDMLRRREPITSLDGVLPALDAHLGLYTDTMADELAAAAAAGAAEFGANDTKTLRRTLDKAGALDAARALVRTDLVGPLRDRLERSIIDGSGDNDDITRRVRSVYREWKTQQIDDQLDDVFRFAFGGGMAVTAEPGASMVWTIDPSQPACADCEDNSLAGPVAAGESYPTGHTAAPAHPGCRCLTLPLRQ